MSAEGRGDPYPCSLPDSLQHLRWGQVKPWIPALNPGLPNCLGHHLLLPGVCVRRQLESESQLGLELRYFSRGCSHPKWVLTDVPNVQPQSIVLKSHCDLKGTWVFIFKSALGLQPLMVGDLFILGSPQPGFWKARLELQSFTTQCAGCLGVGTQG